MSSSSPLSTVRTHHLLSPAELDNLRIVYECLNLSDSGLNPFEMGYLASLFPPLPELELDPSKCQLNVFDDLEWFAPMFDHAFCTFEGELPF